MLFHRSITTGNNVFVGTFLLQVDTTSFEPSFPFNAFFSRAISCLDAMKEGTTSTKADCSAKVCLTREKEVGGRERVVSMIDWMYGMTLDPRWRLVVSFQVFSFSGRRLTLRSQAKKEWRSGLPPRLICSQR